MGQTPWLGDVLAVWHKVEVQCPNGWGSQQVVVPHNGRSEVNVPVFDRPSVPPKSAFKTTSRLNADKPTSQEPEPAHDAPKPSERPVTFPLSLSITEGFYVIDDDDFSDSEPSIRRTKVQMGVDLGFKIKAVPWLVPTVGFWLQLSVPTLVLLGLVSSGIYSHDYSFAHPCWYYCRLNLQSAFWAVLALNLSYGATVF